MNVYANFQFLLLSVFVVVIMGQAEDIQQRGSPSRVTTAQIEAVLKNDRYLKRQLECALGRAPCDMVGKKLKGIFIYIDKFN